MLKKLTFFLIFFYTSSVFFGQKSITPIDSLQKLIKDLKKERSSFINDTSTIRNLNLLASKLISAGELDKGDSLAHAAISIAQTALVDSKGKESVAYKKGMAKGFRNKGNVSFYKENYNAALACYFKEVAIYESLLSDIELPGKLKNGILADLAKALGNIGNVYTRQDNYPEALANNYKSLKLLEGLNNERQEGITYGNIGIVYYRMRTMTRRSSVIKKLWKLLKSLILIQIRRDI
jgi:tetratricopeptide (TPR) repeat protein